MSASERSQQPDKNKVEANRQKPQVRIKTKQSSTTEMERRGQIKTIIYRRSNDKNHDLYQICKTEKFLRNCMVSVEGLTACFDAPSSWPPQLFNVC